MSEVGVGDIFFEGVLDKKGGKLQNKWQTRFFRLRRDRLAWHDNKDGPEKNSIPVSNIGDARKSPTEDDHPFAFILLQAGLSDKHYILSASSERERDEW
eukprot:CAMPEP_0113884312 /NCGR_PEP_ID=MMETSP0780_2-20120614/10186_1 /TAXON_ID=652834 /ORGANISM="Palpitomonas bilix" /LENGTH=98 /DNA_ID=CAMNT_0000871915 /DNA_START=42 /DNA_END=335 /DNA_ORIENTATION=- /assembly_acc=CAM_ASM_000599